MLWFCSPPEFSPPSVHGVMWFAFGDGFDVVSSAGAAGSAVYVCVVGVYVLRHVCVVYIVMCIV